MVSTLHRVRRDSSPIRISADWAIARYPFYGLESVAATGFRVKVSLDREHRKDDPLHQDRRAGACTRARRPCLVGRARRAPRRVPRRVLLCPSPTPRLAWPPQRLAWHGGMG